jgi:hypothetical protein
MPPRLFIESAAPALTLLKLLADGGRIVNLCTGLTRIDYPGYAPYGEVNGTVELLTRYMGEETRTRRH